MKTHYSATNANAKQIEKQTLLQRREQAGDKFDNRAHEHKRPPSINDDMRRGYMKNDLWLDKYCNKTFKLTTNNIGFAQWEYESLRSPMESDNRESGFVSGLLWLNTTTKAKYRCISINNGIATWMPI